jgi:transposase-like protein
MKLEIKSIHELDTYINGDNSQPTTCPKCGSRTEFEEISEDKQQHKCLNCEYEFFLDFEEEDY